jgi:LysM repeat protein
MLMKQEMRNMQIINRINQALGRGADERQLSEITRIVIHHSANPTNGTHLNTAVFENTWRNSPGMGAPNARGGYHEVVLFNGNVEINMQDRRRTWGASNQNSHTWHICLTGQHSGGINNITQTQLNSLASRIATAMRRFGWTAANVDRIVRHKDLPGQSTACNDVNVTNVRNAVRTLLGQPPVTPPPGGSTHTVRAGETLYGIAQMYGTTVAILQQLNNMGTSTTIHVGQVLILPGGSGGNGTHTVRAGETLFGIAQMYGTTVAILQQLNNMGTSTTLQIGQVLRLP